MGVRTPPPLGKKAPLWGFRGRVSVRLGIGLGLGSGVAFLRGDFFLEPDNDVTTNAIQQHNQITLVIIKQLLLSDTNGMQLWECFF